MDTPDVSAVRGYMLDLQDRICTAFTARDGAAFAEQRFEDGGSALARPRVLEGGAVFEKAAVLFTHSLGPKLPAAATARRPELEGRPFQALSVSLITHPRNPYAPTSHMNVRFFLAGDEDDEAAWWFGGGFDLTPIYGFEQDAIHWHRTARSACEPFGTDVYARLKRACDDYFTLPHRQEARGIGGVFFDDWSEGGFGASFGLQRSIGDHYLNAYLPILDRRKDTAYTERERDFQLYRRGRYAEFNLVHDRGTRYGLQSGRRIESVLASLPPLAAWRYDWKAEPGTPEAALTEVFLAPRDWA